MVRLTFPLQSCPPFPNSPPLIGAAGVSGSTGSRTSRIRELREHMAQKLSRRLDVAGSAT